MNTSKKQTQIKLDPRNARVHDTENKKAINRSLRDLGAGRSILMDSENVLIGGNGVYEEAENLGLPIRIIDTDGSELIAIRRNDLKTSDAKRKALALADNKCSDLSSFDDLKVAEIFQELEEFAKASAFSEEEMAEIHKKMAAQKAKLQDTETDDQGEIPFGEELLEAHNYVVLYFTNEVDWLQAQTLFQIQTVKDKGSKPGYIRQGVGRVLNGAQALNSILEKQMEAQQ